MICATCRRPFDGTRTWMRVERGVTLPDGRRIAADRNYCTPACWAADPHLEPQP